mmetsp:Transcript_15508/g.38085  ORF Transcript_15508/g.38085 Transcript_15508/m.38085 type:complete len:379 (-) Transcript_15508:869-2005(-)
MPGPLGLLASPPITSPPVLPPPPKEGHPCCGISRCGNAPWPNRWNSARSRSSSLSAHTTRLTASVPSRSAESTLGRLRRCTARATLSPAAKGSSTPRQYLPGAHELPATQRPAYVLATRPCRHRGSTARKCVKNVTRSSASVAGLLAPHPCQRDARASTGAISRRASDCCRIFDTGNLRMGSRLAARSFSAARSASAAASLTSVRRSAGGRMGGERVCRWKRLIRLRAKELKVPAVASLQSKFLAHILMRNTKSRYRGSRLAMAPSTADLYTPSLPTHTSQFTPVCGSRNLIRGTRACAISCTSVNFWYRSSDATLLRSCTLRLLYPRGCCCRRRPPPRPLVLTAAMGPISLASNQWDAGDTSSEMSMSDPAVWNTET